MNFALALVEPESEYQRARREFIERRLRWKMEAREINAWSIMRAQADADNAFRDVILRTGAVRAALIAQTRGPQFQIKLVQIVISQRYGVSHFDMVSERRTATVVLPRQVACWCAKYLTGRSLPEIGRQFGGRDHENRSPESPKRRFQGDDGSGLCRCRGGPRPAKNRNRRENDSEPNL